MIVEVVGVAAAPARVIRSSQQIIEAHACRNHRRERIEAFEQRPRTIRILVRLTKVLRNPGLDDL